LARLRTSHPRSRTNSRAPSPLSAAIDASLRPNSLLHTQLNFHLDSHLEEGGSNLNAGDRQVRIDRFKLLRMF
jgi:hypothetical protein